jgi:hypothetical protein
MVNIVINIPDEFEQSMNELVSQSGAVNREAWVRNVIGNILLEYQVKKEFSMQMQQRMSILMKYWS